MKKILIFVILMFCFLDIAFAVNPSNLAYITNKCSVVSDGEVTIKVDVISTNDGMVPKLSQKFILGRIENREDYEVFLSNLDSKYVKQILLDTFKDSDDRSDIHLYFDDNVVLKKFESLATFNINIKFGDNVPDKIYVLGSEVTLSEDNEVCEHINGYKTETIKTEVLVNENKSLYYCIIVCLILLCLFELIFVIKKK